LNYKILRSVILLVEIVALVAAKAIQASRNVEKLMLAVTAVKAGAKSRI
jgi:hypothetical protein